LVNVRVNVWEISGTSFHGLYKPTNITGAAPFIDQGAISQGSAAPGPLGEYPGLGRQEKSRKTTC